MALSSLSMDIPRGTYSLSSIDFLVSCVWLSKHLSEFLKAREYLFPSAISFNSPPSYDIFQRIVRGHEEHHWNEFPDKHIGCNKVLS